MQRTVAYSFRRLSTADRDPCSQSCKDARALKLSSQQ